MACCCGAAGSYCCWEKEPTTALNTGDSPPYSYCQDTPCPGMSDAPPNLSLYRSGPHPSGSACAEQCTICSTYPTYPGTPQSPFLRNWVYGYPRNTAINFTLSPNVSFIFFAFSIAIYSGNNRITPMRFLLWDLGEYDSSGTVVRPRALLFDTDWTGGTPPTCAQGSTTSAPIGRINITPIPVVRCVTMQVINPCNLSDWGGQIQSR